jgi:hypothetical protein
MHLYSTTQRPGSSSRPPRSTAARSSFSRRTRRRAPARPTRRSCPTSTRRSACRSRSSSTSLPAGSGSY